MCMMPYLHDRVIRKFGFIERIVAEPADITPVTLDMANEMSAEFKVRNMRLPNPIMEGLPNNVPLYMDWYKRVSHPYICSENSPQMSQRQHEYVNFSFSEF